MAGFVYVCIYVCLILALINWIIGRDYESVCFLNEKLMRDEMSNIFWDSVPVFIILAVSLLAGYVRMVVGC